MFSFELKKSEPISYEKVLGAYIKKNYNEKPKTYENDFRLLENLRIDAVGPGIEVNQTGITNIHRYYEQLKGIQSRFPIDESNIKISFPWHNSLPKDRKLVSSFNISFEKSSLLFNVAMIYAKMGLTKLSTQYKAACGHFCFAAGALKVIIEDYATHLNVPATCDLSEAALTSLLKLNLALAQECFYREATAQGKTKDALISKLTASCGDLFDAAFDPLVNHPVSASFGQNWQCELQAKAIYYFAIAQWKKSNEALAAAKYGEQICRLTASLDLCRRGMELQKSISAELYSDMKRLMEEVELVFRAANRDNDLIYHDHVPDLKSLPTLQRAEMVAPKNPLTEAINTLPIFQSLVPLAIYHAANSYKDRKEKLVQSILNEFSLVDGEIQTALTSMNLPGAVEAAEKPKGLPESVLRKSLELREARAASTLEESLQHVTCLADKAHELIEECAMVLDNEEREDEEMRVQFRGKWSRTPSIELNARLVKMVAKYRNMLREAKLSDETVAKRYEMYIPSIAHLCSSQEELESIIPDCSIASPKAVNPIVEVLKQLLSQLDAIRSRERDVLVGLKATADNEDMTAQLLQTAVNTNFEPIFEDALAVYTQKRDEFLELKESHVRLIEEIRAKNVEFERLHRSHPALQQREYALQSLEEGYQNFKTLSGNFKEGIKFYYEFNKLLADLKSEIDDYCLSRRIEFKDMIRTIQMISAGGGASHAATTAATANPGPSPSMMRTSHEPDQQSIQTVSSYGSEVDVSARRYSDDAASGGNVPFYQPPHSVMQNANLGQPMSGYTMDSSYMSQPPHHSNHSHNPYQSMPQQQLYHAPPPPPQSSTAQYYASQPPPASSASSSMQPQSHSMMMGGSGGAWHPGMPIQYGSSPAHGSGTGDGNSVPPPLPQKPGAGYYPYGNQGR